MLVSKYTAVVFYFTLLRSKYRALDSLTDRFFKPNPIILGQFVAKALERVSFTYEIIVVQFLQQITTRD